MQWDDTKNAGFSTAQSTWLLVVADYVSKNVKEEQQCNLESLLNWSLRRADSTPHC
jgi:alpha-glucosidase